MSWFTPWSMLGRCSQRSPPTKKVWLAKTSRQERIGIQRETNSIFFKSAVRRPDLHVNENQETRLTGAARLFPRALGFMAAVAASQNLQLSRAAIVRLAPKETVYQHIDVGSYYLVRNRFHLVLQIAEGSRLISICMRVGELWWFDDKQHHLAVNTSDEWRIHYIFDRLPEPYRRLASNPLAPPVAEDLKAAEFDLTCPLTL